MRKKINQIKFSTSNKSLIKKINNDLKFSHKHFESFIYIKNLVNEKLINKELLKIAKLANHTFPVTF